ncbi:MAG: response regulator [SAR324 cluster bacterium]|nr:response regulator [SAR324 cluster bacterium]
MKLKLSKPKARDLEPSDNTTRPCILIVDDEQSILDSTCDLLSREFHVLTALGGEEALSIIQGCKTKILAIITDQRMPGMTGLEFLNQSQKYLPNALRIVVTGFTDLDNIISFINEGKIYAYITKPFDPIEFQLNIKRAVDTALLAQENIDLLAQLQIANEQLKNSNRQLVGKVNSQTQEKMRKLHLDCMKLSVSIWELTTLKSKSELALDSKCWATYIDEKGTLRAKNFDRYLDLNSLPKKPKTSLVIKTTQYVLDQCSGEQKFRPLLESYLEEIQQYMISD